MIYRISITDEKDEELLKGSFESDQEWSPAIAQFLLVKLLDEIHPVSVVSGGLTVEEICLALSGRIVEAPPLEEENGS